MKSAIGAAPAGMPAGDLFQRPRPGHRQAQDGADGAVADDGVPVLGEQLPGGVDVAAAAEEQTDRGRGVILPQVVEQRQAALGHLDVGRRGADRVGGGGHQQDRPRLAGGGELEARAAGGVAVDEVEAQPAGGVLQFGAQLCARFTRRLGGQDDDALVFALAPQGLGDGAVRRPGRRWFRRRSAGGRRALTGRSVWPRRCSELLITSAITVKRTPTSRTSPATTWTVPIARWAVPSSSCRLEGSRRWRIADQKAAP